YGSFIIVGIHIETGAQHLYLTGSTGCLLYVYDEGNFSWSFFQLHHIEECFARDRHSPLTTGEGQWKTDGGSCIQPNVRSIGQYYAVLTAGGRADGIVELFPFSGGFA